MPTDIEIASVMAVFRKHTGLMMGRELAVSILESAEQARKTVPREPRIFILEENGLIRYITGKNQQRLE